MGEVGIINVDPARKRVPAAWGAADGSVAGRQNHTTRLGLRQTRGGSKR